MTTADPTPEATVYQTPTVSLHHARALVDAALALAASDPAQPIACAVVGAAGDLVAFAAADGTTPLPRRLAARKALTALLLKRDTAEVRELVTSGAIDLGRLNDADLLAIPGGIPIHVNGVLVGAIGVSGLSPAEDARIASAVRDHRGE